MRLLLAVVLLGFVLLVPLALVAVDRRRMGGGFRTPLRWVCFSGGFWGGGGRGILGIICPGGQDDGGPVTAGSFFEATSAGGLILLS